MTKKIALGLGTLFVFVAYSLGIRHQSLEASPVVTRKNTSSSTTTATSTNGSASPTATTTSPGYKDGTYKGSVQDAYYGNVQVSAIITGGKITNVKFLQYPNTHQTSVMINQQAMPYLIQEAIQSQTANVQIISGATFTSQAFQQSLQDALSQA